MTTKSWPAVGDGGLSDEQWGTMYDSPDGVTEDYTGNSLSLTRISAGDIARIGTGIGRVNGYYCEITAAHDLVLPSVGSTTVYNIWIKYDPTLNVEDGSGDADPLGPCRIGFSAGAPSTINNEKYLLLYSVTRGAGQALADSGVVVVDYRRWSGPHVEWPWTQPTPPIGVSSLPRGSLRYDSTNDRLLVRTLVGGSLGWKEVGVGNLTPFPLASQIVAHDMAPQYYVSPGKIVQFEGNVQRSSGKLGTGSTVTLGTLPAGYRPGGTRGYVTKAFGNTTGHGRVEVSAGGVVTLLSGAGQEDIVWMCLDGISYRAEG